MKLNVSFEEQTKSFDPQLGESNQQFPSEFHGLQIIHGRDGEDGKSAYEIALENGFEGTEAEWLDSLHGKDGKDGKDGLNGKDGIDGYTPQKGVDYYTEADKAEMVSAVIAALPVYDGEVVVV